MALKRDNEITLRWKALNYKDDADARVLSEEQWLQRVSLMR
jgi:hypothetical protein